MIADKLHRVQQRIADACAGITPEAHAAALNLMGGFAPQVTFGSVEEELSRLAGTKRA